MSSHKILLPNLAATESLAIKIAPHVKKGDVLALAGDLGVGKTEFARSLLRCLGVTGDVPSPTFTLVQHYEANELLIAHFDLYRLKSADELDELGWDDALHDGVTIVEWPDRAGARLPADRLDLYFMLEANGLRQCRIGKNRGWAARL